MRGFFTGILYTILSWFVLSCPGFSQSSSMIFDPVKITKTGQTELKYSIDHPQVKNASLKIYSPRKDKKEVSYLLDEFSKSLFPRFFENAYSHKDMYFRIPAEVKFHDKKVHWKVNIYAFGTQEKIRTKRQEFENSKILDTDKHIRMDWNKDTWCVFEEDGKKIGGFTIQVNPFRDTSFLKTRYYSIDPVNDQSWIKLKTPLDSLRQIETFKDPDYGAVGLYQNLPASFLYYAKTRELWVFIQTEPVGHFRLESTRLEMYMENGRNRYVAIQDPPEMKVRKENMETKKAQTIRLALFCRLMIWALNHTGFE